MTALYIFPISIAGLGIIFKKLVMRVYCFDAYRTSMA